MQDGDTSPSPHGHMRTFKRNIPPSYKKKVWGQCPKLQELIAPCEMFRPGKRQGSRHGPSRDQHICAFKDVVAHGHCCRPNKARAAMESLDARTGKVLHKELWGWLCFRAFEAHQFLPVNSNALGAHPLACHTRCRVDHFDCTH